MGYLLSIVVPTKDRYFYLKHLINLVKSFESDEIELVIQDNTKDNSEILEFIEDANFKHLRYDHIVDQIPMSLNSDYAILNSSGKYVCFIGDDDGISRHIIECVKWMDKNNIDVVKSEFALFKWPTFPDGNHIKFSSTLCLGSYDSTYRLYNSKEGLVKLVKTGFTTLKNMPKVYNGIVSRASLDKIYSVCNTFFPGPSPDMANAVALSLVCDNYAFVDFPIIIGGQGKNVGGGVRKIKGGYLKLSETPFLPKDSEEVWETFLPKIWCVETVWPESGIKALRKMNQENYLKYNNIPLLLGRFAANRPDIKEMAYRLSPKKIKIFYYQSITKFKNTKKKYLSLFNYLFRNLDGDNLNIYRNIQTIEEAENFINNKYPNFDIRCAKKN